MFDPGSTSTKTEDQVERAFLLDAVVWQSAAVLKLLAGKDQLLLIKKVPSLYWILVLTLSIMFNGLTSNMMVLPVMEGIDKDLHGGLERKVRVGKQEENHDGMAKCRFGVPIRWIIDQWRAGCAKQVCKGKADGWVVFWVRNQDLYLELTYLPPNIIGWLTSTLLPLWKFVWVINARKELSSML